MSALAADGAILPLDTAPAAVQSAGHAQLVARLERLPVTRRLMLLRVIVGIATFFDAYTVLAYSGVTRGAESKAQAMAAATRSIELAPASAAGHTALACATLLYENNRSRAQQEFERDVLAEAPRRAAGDERAD